jgi:hypothetical protein
VLEPGRLGLGLEEGLLRLLILGLLKGGRRGRRRPTHALRLGGRGGARQAPLVRAAPLRALRHRGWAARRQPAAEPARLARPANKRESVSKSEQHTSDTSRGPWLGFTGGQTQRAPRGGVIPRQWGEQARELRLTSRDMSPDCPVLSSVTLSRYLSSAMARQRALVVVG